MSQLLPACSFSIDIFFIFCLSEILRSSRIPPKNGEGVLFQYFVGCLIRDCSISSGSTLLEIQFCLEIITCDPLAYTMGHLKVIESNEKEESICL